MHVTGGWSAGSPFWCLMESGTAGGAGASRSLRTGRGADLDGGVVLGGHRDLPDLRRFSHEAMATVYEVFAIHPDPQYAAQAAQATFDLVDRLERELSRFLPNSDVTRINHLEAGDRTRVTPTTMECLTIARHMFDLTGGAFDVSVGTGLPSLELDPDESVVRAAAAGVRVDLGGIGKGYAVDLMAEVLEEWELDAALVHGGFSSVLALDAPPDREGWPLTLSSPGTTRELVRMSVRQAAVGASGVRKGDHIVDPRSGRPVSGRLGAWATVPRPRPPDADPVSGPQPRAAAGAVADALATAFMVLDADQIETLCERSDGLEAWIVEDPAPGLGPGLRHFGARTP